MAKWLVIGGLAYLLYTKMKEDRIKEVASETQEDVGTVVSDIKKKIPFF